MKHLAVLPILLLTGLAGCLLEAELAVDEVCVTRSDIALDAAPPGTTAIAQSFTFDDLGELHDLLDTDASLKFVRAEVRSTEDLSFVEAADVMVGDLHAYSCYGDCLKDGAIALAPIAREEVLPVLQQDTIDGFVAIVGTAPTHSWGLSVRVCMSAHLTKTISP